MNPTQQAILTVLSESRSSLYLFDLRDAMKDVGSPCTIRELVKEVISLRQQGFVSMEEYFYELTEMGLEQMLK